MESNEINQKLDKVLSLLEKQAFYARIKFWVSVSFVFLFLVLPLVFLGIMFQKISNNYEKLLNFPQKQIENNRYINQFFDFFE